MVRRTGDMSKHEAELILGLIGTYDARKLRQAYARQAMSWHPDRQEEGAARERAEKRMIEVNIAYARLKGLFVDGTTTVATEGAKWARTAKGATVGTTPTGRDRNYASPGATAPTTPRDNDGPRSSPPPPPSPPPRPRPPQTTWRHGPPTAPPPPPAGVPVDAPPKPRERGFAYRLIKRFPWRIAVLVVVLLLFVSPDHAGMDYIANFGRFHFVTLYQGGFLDFLLWQVVIVPLAVYNLFTGAITDPLLKQPLLWLAERGERQRP